MTETNYSKIEVIWISFLVLILFRISKSEASIVRMSVRLIVTDSSPQ